LDPKKGCLGLTSYLESSLDELEQTQQQYDTAIQKSRELQQKVETDTVLLSDLLSCGSSDVDFFRELVTKIENGRYVIKNEVRYLFDTNFCLIEEIKTQFLEENGCNEKINVNLFIEGAYVILIKRIEEFYKVNIDEYIHHEVNYMCSHLYFEYAKFKEKYKGILKRREIRELRDLFKDF
jgi:hypothetical protein